MSAPVDIDPDSRRDTPVTDLPPDDYVDIGFDTPRGTSARDVGSVALEAVDATDRGFGVLDELEVVPASADPNEPQVADDPAPSGSGTGTADEMLRVDVETNADATGGDNVAPPGSGDGGKKYGGDGGSGDDDEHHDEGSQQPDRPDAAKKVGAAAIEVADPRTEATRLFADQVAEIDRLKGAAGRYKEIEGRPDPFAVKPEGPRKPSFAHMQKGGEMAALAATVQANPNWEGPRVLWPKERLITSAHRATIAELKASRDQLRAVNTVLIRQEEQESAAVEAGTIHRVPVEELDSLHADLARAAGRMPSAETVNAIIESYNWLVGVKGERVLERPEPGITANLLPMKVRYGAHVGPIEKGRDTALEMAEGRARLVASAGEIYQDIRGAALRGEDTTLDELIDVLVSTKEEIMGDEVIAAVSGREPAAGRYVAAESYIIAEIEAAVKERTRLDPDFLKDEEMARMIDQLKKPVLANIADKVQLEHETEVTRDLSRGITQSRDILVGPQRVLNGMKQTSQLSELAEGISGITNDQEGGARMLERAEGGLLLATVADPTRLSTYTSTTERVRLAAEDDEALSILSKDEARTRAIRDVQRVDPELLIYGLWQKLASERNHDALTTALTEDQLLEARTALGRYLDPEYSESEEDDPGGATEDEPLPGDKLDAAMRAAGEDMLEQIEQGLDIEGGLLSIMDQLGLTLPDEQYDELLRQANAELFGTEGIDLEAELLQMLGELEATDAARALLPGEDGADEGMEPEAEEAPQTIDEVVEEYENLGFTVFPVGEEAFRQAQDIEEEARRYDANVRIDMDRVRAMVQVAKAYQDWRLREGIPEDRRHMFIARGQLGNRGTVRVENGERARNEYLVLVILEADEQGNIRQQCWADSPITRRNASYVWDSEAARLPFPNWERIYAGTKREARNEGRARQLKHTSPGDKDVNVTMMQRVWSLLTGSPDEFFRNTRFL